MVVKIAGGALGSDPKYSEKLKSAVLNVDLFGEAYKVRLEADSYLDNHRLAISAVEIGQEWEPFGTLTCNIPEVVLRENEILVKSWSENAALAKAARTCGLFRDTGKRVPTGFVEAEVWEVL